MISRLIPILVLVLALGRAAPALEFSGTLVSSNGAPPVEKLVVLVEHHENRHAEHPDTFAIRCQPDQAGRFTIKLPDYKKQYMLFVMDGSNHIYTGYAHLGETTNFGVIAVQAGGAVMGTVQSQDHKLLPDLELVLEFRLLPHTCTHCAEAARCRTDAKGAFSFAGLAPGEYRYRPVSDAYAAQDGTINVTEDPAFLNLILTQAAWVKGKINDPQGKPVAGIRVRMNDQVARSDDQGNYRLGGITSGTNYVSVSGEGYVLDKGKEEHGYAQVICVSGKEAVKDFTVIPAGVLRLALEPDVPDLLLPAELEVRLMTGTEHGSSSEEMSAPLVSKVAVFSNVPPGDFTVTLCNDELPSVSTNGTIISGQETRLALRVSKSYTYKGLVVNAAGKPVGSVTISVRPEKEKEEAGEDEMFAMRHGENAKQAETDDQGKFTLKGLAVGSYRLEATHKDLVPTNFAVNIAGDIDAMAAPLVMQEGLKVSGAVMSADGKPALGHRVSLHSVYSPEMALSGQQTIYKYGEAGTNGVFEFKGLPPGKFTLSVLDSDHNEITTLEKVEAGSEDIIVTLAKMRLITGTVVDTGGKPIQGVSIHAVKSQKRGSGSMDFYPSSRSTVNTDTNGHFEISVREGASYDIVADLPPLLPAKAAVNLSPGATFSGAPLNLVMAHGYKISGTVVAADGQTAVQGLSVNIAPGRAMMMAGPRTDKALSAETDAQGRFTLDGVPPGVVSLNVYAKSAENPQVLTTKEALVDTNKTTEVRIVLPKVGSINGRFASEGPKKAGVVHVSLSSIQGEGRLNYNTRSNARGEFGFTNIPAGKYMAMAFGERTRPDSAPTPEMIEVVAGQTVEVTLGQKAPAAGAPSLTGTVGKDNVPFQAGEITFMPTQTNNASKEDLMALYGKMARGKIGSNGVYSVKSLEPGEYMCVVMPREPGKKPRYDGSDYPKSYQINVKLAAGQTNLDIRFAGFTLSGTVIGPEGKPVEKAYVVAAPSGAKGFKHMAGHHAQTDTQGQYRVECVPAGVYDITVHHQEYGMMSRKNVTVNEKSNRVDLTLASGVKVTGTVTLSTGGSAAGAWVLLTTGDELSGGFGSVEEDGTYEMKEPVPKGIYQIFIVQKGYALEAGTLNLATNAVYNATLMPGGDVRVTVQKQGKPVSGKTVQVKAADGSALVRLSADNTQYGGYYGEFGLTIPVTDEKGQVMIRALKPGKYTLSLEAEKVSVQVDVKQLETAEAALDLR